MAQVNVSDNGKLSVMEAIQSRRTIFKFKPDPIPKDVLEDLLLLGYGCQTIILLNRGGLPSLVKV